MQEDYVLFSGENQARHAVRLELRITLLKECQQLFSHAADIVGVD